MIEGELLRRLDRIEGMLEWLCMGMASPYPMADPPPKEKTPLEIRKDVAKYVASAIFSYSKYPSTKTVKVRVDVDDGYYMETTAGVPPLNASPAQPRQE